MLCLSKELAQPALQNPEIVLFSSEQNFLSQKDKFVVNGIF